MKQASTILIPFSLVYPDEKNSPEYHYVLGVSRKDDKTAFGLPGGKVDPGETPEDAAIRELFEETGIVAEEITLLHDGPFEYGYHEYTYVVRKCVMPDTHSVHEKETGVVKWCSWDELLTGPFGKWNTVLRNKLKDYESTN